MEFKMPVRYLEAYLPTPRSRKLRYREANDSITVDVLSLSAGEILAVLRVHDYSIHAGGFEAETIYAHSGQLWRRSYEHDFYSGAAHTPQQLRPLRKCLGDIVRMVRLETSKRNTQKPANMPRVSC